MLWSHDTQEESITSLVVVMMDQLPWQHYSLMHHHHHLVTCRSVIMRYTRSLMLTHHVVQVCNSILLYVDISNCLLLFLSLIPFYASLLHVKQRYCIMYQNCCSITLSVTMVTVCQYSYRSKMVTRLWQVHNSIYWS